MKINQGEKKFQEKLEAEGKRFILQPYIPELHMRPDFYCIDNETYYEVIGSRSGYCLRKDKIAEAIKKGIKLKIVNPDGTPYAPKPRGRPQKSHKKKTSDYYLKVDDQFWKVVKIETAREGITIKTLILTLLDKWLREEKVS